MISSITSYQKLLVRGGVGVGGQTIQDIIDFDNEHRIRPDTADNDCCSLRLVDDCDRNEHFFQIFLILLGYNF